MHQLRRFEASGQAAHARERCGPNATCGDGS